MRHDQAMSIDPVAAYRWTGGANVPVASGRISATFPLAVLEINNGTLVFRIRPRWLQAIVGAQTLKVSAGDGTVLFPVDQLAGIGVGVRPIGQPAWYFRSFTQNDILAAAAAVGFQVSPTLGRWGR
jgi:hypothetical protein